MKNLYIYGDSNTYGYDPSEYLTFRYREDLIWTEKLRKALSGKWTIFADGQNGREIPGHDLEFSALFFRMEKACPVDLFIIMLGTNDLLVSMYPDPAKVGERMRNALMRISEKVAPERIMVIAPPLIRMPAENGWPAVDTSDGSLSRALRDAAGDAGCLFLDSVPWDSPLAFDGVHLSEDGHRVFAEHLISWFKEHEAG
ncbi:MAG: lipase [Lachnospiraceae bacterium]|nr:lipase [Lachnospiraceae bacterium]